VSFPQPDSAAPVLGGKQFWRLQTLLSSPGDIYESQVGALGMVVGPDSDISSYLVTYYDQESSTLVSQLIVSPDRDTIGRIDARNDQPYAAPGSRKGRILISIADIYDPVVRPANYTNGEDAIEYETPIIDLIQYFVNPPSITPQRSDRGFGYQYLRPPLVAGKSSFLLIPGYGRKSGYFTFTNKDTGGNTVTVRVSGLKLATTNGAAETSLSTNALAPNASAQFAYKSSANGLWDLFAIELDNYHGNAMPVSITLSDDPL